MPVFIGEIIPPSSLTFKKHTISDQKTNTGNQDRMRVDSNDPSEGVFTVNFLT